MSDKPDKKIPERFLEVPQVYIGDELVHDPEEPDKHNDKLERLIHEAEEKQRKSKD